MRLSAQNSHYSADKNNNRKQLNDSFNKSIVGRHKANPNI